MAHDINRVPQSICIGKRGETQATTVDFDVTDWLAAYPDGELYIYAVRPGESTSYTIASFAEVVGADGTYRWTVSDVDTAIAGQGYAQVVLLDAGLVKESVQFITVIEPGIGTSGGVLPAIPTITTQGDLLTRDGTDYVRLPIGTSGQVLSTDGTDPAWTSLSDLASTLFLLTHPVGSIYMSVSATSPQTTYGGTWAAWGAGKVPVGIDAADGDFDTAEETGGAKTHTLTAAELAAHAHGGYNTAAFLTTRGTDSSEIDGLEVGTGFAEAGAQGGVRRNTNTASAGSGSAHNNLQPYIVCYMWKRTA